MSPENSTTICKSDIFPFLTLPRELQDLVYEKYYEDSELTIDLKHHNDNSVSPDFDTPVFKGIPSSNVEVLNRQIRKDAKKAKEAYLSQILKITGNSILPRLLEGFIFEPRYHWIRGHIEEIFMATEGVQFEGRKDWASLLEAFPNTEAIYLQHRCFAEYRKLDTYDKFSRELRENEQRYSRWAKGMMEPEFETNHLTKALNSAGRKVRLGVLFQWVGVLFDADKSFSLVMKGEISKRGIWNVFCGLIDGKHRFDWDDPLPQGAVAWEIGA